MCHHKHTHAHTHCSFQRRRSLSFLPDASISLAHFHYILLKIYFHCFLRCLKTPCSLLFVIIALFCRFSSFLGCWCTLLLLFFLFFLSFLSSFALPPDPSFLRNFCSSQPFMFCSASSERGEELQLWLLWENHSQSFPVRLDVPAFFLRSPSFLFQSIPRLPFILGFILSFFGSILISHTFVCIDGAPCLCFPA